MARPLDFILGEIVRVADALGIDPRDLARDTFVKHSEVSCPDLHFYGGFKKLKRNAAAELGIAPKYDAKQKRGVELRNNYVSLLERKASTIDYLSDKLEKILAEAFERAPIPVNKKAKPSKKRKVKRELCPLFGDTHYGACVEPSEVPNNKYNWTIASRRTARQVEQIMSWKPEYREETNLNVSFLGDLIQGAIHTLEEGKLTLVAEQIHGAVSILVQALDQLSSAYDKIDVYGTPGNHERHPHRGGRATHAKWDSFAASIFLALRMAFRNNKSITFHFPRTPYFSFKLFDRHLLYGTHGDTVTTVGNIGKRIDVTSIAERIYALDASKVFDKTVDVAMFGHVHVPCYSILANGCNLVVNGNMSGIESFAQSHGIHANEPTQSIFESVERHPVGDFRILRLKEADDQARYDEIIRPPAFWSQAPLAAAAS